ncbi:MAG: hypothetical protein K8F36_16035 [Melioribacteraceae bacterium]|nr:hypothetical protein [Melioribacteraceae bacterium]MCO6474541.1 hypothetical protein [Melioribacteraceae bacterium]MDD3557414.1 hypothetical protein [Melioribacteraceae bacterium]
MKKILLSPLFLLFLTNLYAQSNSKDFLDLQADLYMNNQTLADLDESEYIQAKKSAGLAVLYSLLVPGMGELYAGDYSLGKYLTITEGVLWGTFAGFTIYGNQQATNYKSFAESYGSVNLDGKDDQFFATIGLYQNIEDYNNEKLLNREFDLVLNPETHYWKWQSQDQRKEYRNTWSDSEAAFDKIQFVVGAMILNRVVSAINAVRLVSAYNKNLENEQLSWSLSVGMKKYHITLPTSLTLNFRSAF